VQIDGPSTRLKAGERITHESPHYRSRPGSAGTGRRLAGSRPPSEPRILGVMPPCVFLWLRHVGPKLGGSTNELPARDPHRRSIPRCPDCRTELRQIVHHRHLRECGVADPPTIIGDRRTSGPSSRPNGGRAHGLGCSNSVTAIPPGGSSPAGTTIRGMLGPPGARTRRLRPPPRRG